MKKWIVLLGIVAAACFAAALSYFVRYHAAEERNNTTLEALSEKRRQSLVQVLETDAPQDSVLSTAAAISEVAAPPTTEAVLHETEPSSSEIASAETVSNTLNVISTEAVPSTTNVVSDETAPRASNVDSNAAELSATEVAVKATALPTVEPTVTPGLSELVLDLSQEELDAMRPKAVVSQGRTATIADASDGSAGIDRTVRTDALAYAYLEKKALDENQILPELRDIYAENHDLVGWLYIADTVIDYPVVQTADSEFYLDHDFHGEENVNGQIILDSRCDPYTPSYNLVISGHHMKNGSMFGNLPLYRRESYWAEHRLVEFDTLMERKQYVIFAAFYSADYDEDEEGFRYNADIQYRIDAEQWLKEIAENQIYETGIDVRFGDEFITLTTCYRELHRNGRFVVVARRVREGEVLE